MQTVSSEYAQAYAEGDIYVTSRVTVEFGSNRFNDGQVITTSGTKLVNRGIDGSLQSAQAEFWKPSEVFNNKNRNTMKWLVLDSGATLKAEEDGSGYRVINLDDGEYERGWWSANKSDGTGSFGVAEFVQSEFFMPDAITPFPRRINKISLYTTEGYPNMKEVTVSYKDSVAGWTDVATNYVLGQNTYLHEWSVPSEPLVTGLRVRVHKTWEVNDFARISELQGYYIKDISNDIVNVELRETRQEYDSTVPVGITAANTVDIEIDNTTGQYNIENVDSTYYPYIAQNNRVLVEFGVDKNQGVGSPNYEYTPFGEFWVDEWQNDTGSMTARFSARDFSKFIQDEVSNITRVWTNTNISTVFYDLMARQGMPFDRINIDQTNLRGFEILFIKDQSIWAFMQEVAFADQGIFGFDRNGEFYYHSYNRLNTSPYNSSVYNLSYDTNIENGTQQTELYINKVIARVSPYSTDETGRRAIWSVNENTVLTWAKLGADITSTATTIPVVAATNQNNGNLTDNLWEDKNGYLWFPTLDSNGIATSGELVKYKSRSDSNFLECERGYLGTTAVAHTSGAYIGEVNVFDIEFDNAPALQVYFPFVTAIDSLEKLVDEGVPQAHVILWDYNSFGAKLAIGNTVNWYTLLSGQEATFKDKFDGNSDPDDDVLFEFSTVVAGVVAVEKTGKEQIGRDAEYTAENKDYQRRYGKNELQIDNAWIQSKAHAEDIVAIIIDEFKNPRDIVRIDVLAYPPVELADRVTITNLPQLDIINKQYHVIEISLTFDGGLMGSYTLREVKA